MPHNRSLYSFGKFPTFKEEEAATSLKRALNAPNFTHKKRGRDVTALLLTTLLLQVTAVQLHNERM